MKSPWPLKSYGVHATQKECYCFSKFPTLPQAREHAEALRGDGYKVVVTCVTEREVK